MTEAGIGTSPVRADALAKVRGEFVFASDIRADGLLEGVTVRSPHAHARIIEIDVSAARDLPGVIAVLTRADVPGRATFGLEFADQPVLASDVVRHVGEPVALVAAVDVTTARRAARAVRVQYESLAPVLDPVLALDPASQLVHPGGNLLRHVVVERGDVDAVEGVDVWVEGWYETGVQDQAFLGPEAGVAHPGADGGVDLHVATQWLHLDRSQVAASLGLDESLVRVHLAGVGGAFGGREDVSLQIHVCLLALATGRSVRMAYTREESFLGHPHRHPSRTWLRHGARRDGTLLAVTGSMVLDAGAYASSSSAVTVNAATFLTGPYDVPHVRVAVSTAFTNNPPNGAMRGFGAPQACVAYEAQMDRLATALDLDPVELRLRNCVRPGTVLPTGQRVAAPAPVAELLERCRSAPLPTRRVAPNATRAVGYATGYKNLAYSSGFDDSAEVEVTLASGPDGLVATIRTSAVEMGQGLDTILRQIVRSELGVERVDLLQPDTAIGSAGSSSASRQTMMSGGAVRLACEAIRDELARRTATAGARAGEDPAALLAPPISARRVYHHRATTPLDDHGQGEPHAAFAFVAQRAVVDVDVDLGVARVVQVDCVEDVGRLMHPAAAEGQVEGGTLQGIGLALMEELVLTDGRPANTDFTDYLIPALADAPTVVTSWIEQPDPALPYGAKGVGELATVVSTAAVMAALRAATGRELPRAPVSPDALIGLDDPAAPPMPDLSHLQVGVAPWLVALRSGQAELLAPGT